MSFSVKIGSPLKKYTGVGIITKYIKDTCFRLSVWIKGTSNEYLLSTKIKELIYWMFNILITGFAIKYCIENRNVLSYGLTTVIIMYYIEWFVKLIKKQDKK